MWPTVGALAGLIAGSFIATLALRWPEARGLGGRSACDHCGVILSARDLVPLLSFAVQGGSCRHCDGPIAWRHPAIEAAAALLGAAAFWAAPGWPGLATAVFAWALLALLVLDADHFWLPDRITLPLLALGVVAGPGAPADRLWAAAIAGGALWALSLSYRWWRGRDGLGLGDVKLAAAIGAWLSPMLLAPLLLLAAVLGMGLVLVDRWRHGPVAADMRLPFGACLAAAALPLHLLLVGRG